MVRHLIPSARAPWRRFRVAPPIDAILRAMPGEHRPILAPQLRGHVQPRIIDALGRRGWHVHRVGQAAYVHSPDDTLHLILGVWPRRGTRPSWANRLGGWSAALGRRFDRLAIEQRWRRLERDAGGRFARLLPWYHWPTPALYRFAPSQPSPLELEAQRAFEHNRRIRIARGLERPDEPELVLRAMWGDR